MTIELNNKSMQLKWNNYTVLFDKTRCDPMWGDGIRTILERLCDQILNIASNECWMMYDMGTRSLQKKYLLISHSLPFIYILQYISEFLDARALENRCGFEKYLVKCECDTCRLLCYNIRGIVWRILSFCFSTYEMCVYVTSAAAKKNNDRGAGCTHTHRITQHHPASPSVTHKTHSHARIH